MTAITINKTGRKLDSPEDFNYQCINENCENTNFDSKPFLPDSEFPQGAEVKQYDLDPEVCLQCQGVTLI